jgi:uncharacterized membrane protein YqhA
MPGWIQKLLDSTGAKDYVKGFAIAAMLVALALILVTLGTYQLFKD